MPRDLSRSITPPPASAPSLSREPPECPARPATPSVPPSAPRMPRAPQFFPPKLLAACAVLLEPVVPQEKSRRWPRCGPSRGPCSLPERGRMHPRGMAGGEPQVPSPALAALTGCPASCAGRPLDPLNVWRWNFLSGAPCSVAWSGSPAQGLVPRYLLSACCVPGAFLGVTDGALN